VVDGPQALDRLRLAHDNARPYTLAILAYQMPGMDGIALARRIKADPVLAPVRLILLTSFGYRGHSGEAQRAGFEAYLLKPIRQSLLYDCLVTVMGIAPAPSPARLITRHILTEEQAQWRARILVAEDNVVNQKVAVRMLEKLGCRVDVVANGLEAVEASGRIAYDCILMDCQMPEMDGYKATAVIRQRDAHTGGRTPIIAMTANALQGDRERCLEAGMDDYVSKPVQSKELVVTLRKWIQPLEGTFAHAVPTVSEPTVLLEPVGQVQPPALDAEAFAALKELYNNADPGSLPSLVEAFIQDTAVHLDTLRQAVAADDAAALERTGHTLESSSANVGTLGMAALCRELQILGRAGSTAAAPAVVAQLLGEFDRVCQTLAQECRKMCEASPTPHH